MANNVSPITTSAPSAPNRATYANIEAIGAAFLSGLAAIIEQHEARIAELEAEVASKPTPEVVDFCRTRRTWTVKQLAKDLQVHENTVLNWIALPSDNPRHINSFQPGGTGPHYILPEHVANWLRRNEAFAS